ncbi:dioxygenase family protein [Arthrobacter sp. KNU-44]|uniref:dioxygenase family protein n=1 Tax=unclassified Arthrobacter TaxID=235627 RepID=UPI003F430063
MRTPNPGNTTAAPAGRSRSTAAADALIPASHPLAAHLRRAALANEKAPHQPWSAQDGPMPSLYISHGAPNTFEDTAWMQQLHGWARSMPKPKAIVVISAHWESDSLGITSTTPAELVYDFGGFAPMYYGLRYDSPDPSDLAQQIMNVLPTTEHVYEHRGRGLDHGAWVPLKAMYPAADIPILQLSLPTHDTRRLFSLGQRLKKLREEGILVIGSGFMTHGLQYADASHRTTPPTWSIEFDQWAADALARGDVDELARFRTHAPGAQRSHPTVEHFTPLFVTLGAATDPTAPVTTTIDGFVIGLSKRSFQTA